WYSSSFGELAGGLTGFAGSFSKTALVLTADGRALLGMNTPSKPGGLESYVARLATVPLTGTAPVSAGAGGEFDDPQLTQPLVLADGTPALTWVSGIDEKRFTLHLATEGGVRPAPGPEPRVRFGAPAERVLAYNDSLRLPVSCSAPCAVRGQIV